MSAFDVLAVSAVALRKESVDRNQGVHYDNYNLHWSLSARRAWIEIATVNTVISCIMVALRKESVDRNKVTEAKFFCIGVALRKESVDRNRYHCDDFAD